MLAVAILAAGKGTRMKNSLPKVLEPLGETTLLERVLNSFGNFYFSLKNHDLKNFPISENHPQIGTPRRSAIRGDSTARSRSGVVASGQMRLARGRRGRGASPGRPRDTAGTSRPAPVRGTAQSTPVSPSPPAKIQIFSQK